MKLRNYQQESIDALMRYFQRTKTGNPILALPTGAGKSVIQAAFIKQALEQWPGQRFLLLAHVKELLEQNAEKIRAMCPGVSVGIYSAGLDKREANAQVVVAGIQSVWRKAQELGAFSLVFIDECHMVGGDKNSMYRTMLGKLSQFHGHLRVVGMSATPYRLDSGSLTQGEDAIFDEVAHSVDIADLIEQGYLTKIVTAKHLNKVKVEGVKTARGDFKVGELASFMMRQNRTEEALKDAMLRAGDRGGWLVFCVSVEHAEQAAAFLRERGMNADCITGETPAEDRAEMLRMFKNGDLKALASVGVLTTGFDAPRADTLICLRPTQSRGLWVQMCGRITRLFKGKRTALVLDYTQNTEYHGPLNHNYVDRRGNGQSRTVDIGEKPCPGCFRPISQRAMRHDDCGWVNRPEHREPEHNMAPSHGELIAAPMQWKNVATWGMFKHTKKGAERSTLRVEYYCGLAVYKEWVCLEHAGFARSKAEKWWRTVTGNPDAVAPVTVDEALTKLTELRKPSRIAVKKDGKWWRVDEHEFAPVKKDLFDLK